MRPGPLSATALSPGFLLVLCAAFAGASLQLARPALHGPFLTDDYFVIVDNPYVHELSLANAAVLLDPRGAPVASTGNYAPVHLFLHAIEWRLFGSSTFGYHVANAVLHGLASALLVVFFARFGLPREAAVFGGVVFLLHPANTEVVAWIFQLKTIVALALSLAALLAFERRPALATALFALALLTKITSASALPAAAALAWIGRGRGRWIAVWAVLFAAIGSAEMAGFQHLGAVDVPGIADPWLRARTIVAVAMRYLVMAATSLLTSTSHEPPPATSLLDPWWLSGLAALALLAARTLWALRQRRVEALYWILAAAAFAPVSQIFPFRFPMADRYLYPILPGLIGGGLLACLPALAGLGAWLRARAKGRPIAEGMAALLAIAVVATFAARSHQRASVFRSGTAMMRDAALHYPEGLQANLLRAMEAGRAGDAAAAAAALRAASERGFANFWQPMHDPDFAAVRDQPAFRAVLREIAMRSIERGARLEDPVQSELLMIARAHMLRDEPGAAVRVLERALEVGGPFDRIVATELAQARLRARPGAR